MSDVQLGIKITADGSKAVASLNQVAGATKGVGSSTSYASSELKRMTADLMRQSDAARQSARAMAEAQADAKTAASSFSGLGTAIGFVTSVMSGRELYGIIAEYDRLNASLKTVTGSTQTAVAVMDGLKQFARETPYELSQVTEAFIRMRALGLDASIEAMRSMGNTASATTKPLMQFVEAVADATTFQFERLREFGIVARQEGDQITFIFDKTETVVRKDATAIQEYLLQLGRTKFAGGMVDQMNTVDGAISNVKDSFSQLVDTIGNLGVRDALKKGFAGVTEFLDQLRQDIESVHSMGQSGTKANLENQIAMYRNIVDRLSRGGADVTVGIGSTEAAIGRSKALADAKIKLAELEKQLATINGEIVKSTDAAKSAAVTSVAGVANSATAALRGLNAEQQRVANQIIESAKAAKLDPALALAVAKTESRFRQSARSPVGAMGVMQLMPGTARGLGVNPANEQENIQGGIKYLKQLQGEFKTLTQIAAGYNAGPGNVRNDKWMRFAETRDYVQKVTAAYQQFKAELSQDDGFNVAREQFDTLRDATQRYINNLDDQAKAAQRQAEITVSGIDNQIAALDRERDAWDKNQQDKIDAAKGSYDEMARLEAERAAKLQEFANQELTLIQQQYDARKRAMEAAAGAYQRQLSNPNLTDDEERRAKQGLADIQADLVKLANDRAEAEAKAGLAALEANRGGAELAQKQRAFIANINADLEFQKQLYLQLKAAKEAGATPEGLAVIRAGYEAGRNVAQSVSQEEIALIQKKIDQNEIVKQQINEITQTDQDRAESVREQQLRENAYWDQLINRMEQYADTWREITGSQNDAFSRLAIQTNQYAKSVDQIGKAYEDLNKTKGDPAGVLGIAEGASQAQAALNLMAQTMIALRSQYAEGTQGYEDMTAAAERMMEVQRALQLVEAVLGVVHQATAGDVYTAIPRMIGVAAMMASMGLQTGAGGSANASVKYAAQAGQQDSGVFGDPTKASDSIVKSLELIRDNSSNDLNYSAAMLRALEGIEAAMKGVTNSVIRGVQPINVKTGRLSGLGDLDAGGIDPLGAMIGDLIFSTHRKIADFGIQASQQMLADILTKGFSGQVYTDIETTTKVLGMTVSKSVKTAFSDLDPTVARQFTKAFQSIRRAIIEGGKAFDLTAADFNQRLKGFVVDMGKISTKDLTGEQLQEKITQMFSEQSDRIARRFMPKLGPFQQVGEGYFETFIRVAESVNRAGGELERLGVQAINFRDVVDKQSDIAAEIVRQSLLAQQGLGEGVSQYIQELTGSAEEIIDAYKKLKEASALLKTAGVMGGDANLNRTMINAAGGLDAFVSSMQDFKDTFLTDAERLAGDARDMAGEFAKLGLRMPTTNDEFKKLVQGLDTSTEAGQKLFGKLVSLSGGFAKLTAAVQTSMDALKSAYDTAKAQSKSLHDYLAGLRTGDSAAGSPMDRYRAAKARFDDLKIRAQLGDQSAIDALQGAAADYLSLSKLIFAGTEQYARDLNAVEVGLGKLAGIIDDQISAAEKQVPALLDNTSAITSLNAALARYTSAVDALKKATDDAATAYATASTALVTAIGGLDLIGGGTGGTQPIGPAGPPPESTPIRPAGPPPYAMGGLAAPGWALVGEQGPELVNFTSPARVYTATQTREALSQKDDGKTFAALEAIKDEMRALVRTQSGANPAIIGELQALRARLDQLERNQRIKA